MKDIDGYVTKDDLYRLISQIKRNPYFVVDDKTCHIITEAISNMKTSDVQPVDRWTSIEESKPKDMQQVLAVVDGDVREAFYDAGCFIGSNFYRSINEVKWWQPLPEPPKDGDTECQ